MSTKALSPSEYYVIGLQKDVIKHSIKHQCQRTYIIKDMLQTALTLSLLEGVTPGNLREACDQIITGSAAQLKILKTNDTQH